MKKIFLPIILFFLLTIIYMPNLAEAAFVNCGNAGQSPCTICDFFSTLTEIYKFIVLDIATPLAIIAITIGGIFMLISAGNPSLMSTGKNIFYVAIIGLVLVFCSYLIIGFIMTTIGYSLNGGNWWSLNMTCS